MMLPLFRRADCGQRLLAALSLAVLAAGCATVTYLQLPRPERRHYFELAAVGTQQDADRYAALPDSAARADYWRRFWTEKDPTPTTERNERYEAHQARVAFADDNFGSLNYCWDDRGKIYIKFGEPDVREWNPMGSSPGTVEMMGQPGHSRDGVTDQTTSVLPTRGWERWTYSRLGHEFVFVQTDVGYRLSTSLYSAASQSYVTAEKLITATEVDRSLLDVQLPRDDFKYDYGQPLNFPFNLTRFGGPQGAEVWICYSVPLAQISYDESTHQATLARSIVVQDEGLHEVARDDRTLTPPDAGRRVADAQAIDVCRFDLRPGAYSMAISLRDSGANKTGIYTYKFSVIDYLRGAEETSDLLLAREIQYDTTGSKFNKGPYRIVPQPGASFKAGQILYLYFEIYNLRPDPARQYRAEATYYILSQHGGTAKTTQPVVLDAGGPTLTRATALGLSDLKEGSYIAMVHVKDLATGKTRKLAAGFAIVK